MLLKAGLPVLSGKEISAYTIVHNHAQVSKMLEDQFTSWQPGSSHGYHVITYGLYVDQLIRHVDRKQRGVSDYFNDEIAKPFGKWIVDGNMKNVKNNYVNKFSYHL